MVPARISVITPSIEATSDLDRCIRNVLAQGHSNVEHIVVCSSQKDCFSLRRYHPHVIWLDVLDNGEGCALNAAMAHLSGDIVCVIKADEWLEPGAFAAVLQAFVANPGTAVVFGNCHMVCEEGQVLWLKRSHPDTDLFYLLRCWLEPTHPHAPAVFYASQIIREVGPFNSALDGSLHYEYWLRVAHRHPWTHLDLALANSRPRRRHDNPWPVLLPYLSDLPKPVKESFWNEYYQIQQHYRCKDETPVEFIDEARTLAISNVVLQSVSGDSPAQLADLLLQVLSTPEACLSFCENLVRYCDRGHNVRPQLQSLRDRLEPLALWPVDWFLHRPPNPIAELVSANCQQGQDRTQIAAGSRFEEALRQIFATYRPQKIVETGTYLGLGTTSIIASALRDLAIQDTTFLSIEVNPQHFARACQNLANQGFDQVEVLHGLSIPRAALPSLEEIEKHTVLEIEFPGIVVDHHPGERAQRYFEETHFEAPEDLLGKALTRFGGRPDFVLLDSAGSLGNVEFNYLVNRLEGPCLIALDDIHHLKHRRSYLQMRADPRFQILQTGDEKFGFAFARFTPHPVLATTCPAPRKILWHRMDSIGDALLALSMLPWLKAKYPNSTITVLCQSHLRELYQACPLVDETLAFTKKWLAEDDEYCRSSQHKVQRLEADLLLNSTFSREPISEKLALAVGAREKIGFHGDLCNISQQDLDEVNRDYTRLVQDTRPKALELHRHELFLQALEINCSPLRPLIWTRPQDEQFAETFFAREGLTSDRTIALFAGAQHSYRHCGVLGKGLARLAQERGFRVLALGSAGEHELNEANCRDLGVDYLNLCGRLNLLETAALLRRCRLAVGTETSLAHMACALEVDNVVVIGGGNYGRFMPYSRQTALVCLPLPCYNCNWQCHHPAHYCLSNIESQSIDYAIQQTLDNPASRPRVFCQSSQWEAPKVPGVEVEVVAIPASGDFRADPLL